MKRNLFWITAGLLATAALCPAESASGTVADATAAFSRLKSLAGEWEADTTMGKVHVSYELIAGGTALVERESSEHMAPMMTVYHLDGKRLMLTHYCMAGNQPRMEAAGYDAAAGRLRFRFLDATNLPNPAAGHMHAAELRFIDRDHMIAEWQFFEDGRLKTTESAQYTRIH